MSAYVAFLELSEVLWNMVLSMGMSGLTWKSGIGLYIIFSFWACLTVSILVLMEGLSAFLHTLRLHWCVVSCIATRTHRYFAVFVSGWNSRASFTRGLVTPSNRSLSN